LLQEDSFTVCNFCYEVYLQSHALKLHCSRANHFVDAQQNRINMHVSSSVYDISGLAYYLNQNYAVRWMQIHAFFKASSVILPTC